MLFMLSPKFDDSDEFGSGLGVIGMKLGVNDGTVAAERSGGIEIWSVFCFFAAVPFNELLSNG
jgi:hypothetical protein